MEGSKLDNNKKLLHAGVSLTEVARNHGVGRATLYRALAAESKL